MTKPQTVSAAVIPRIEDRCAQELAIHSGGVCLIESLSHVDIGNGPGDDEPIGADATVQRTLRVTVHVFDVFGDAHTEHVEVEVRVARNERIVGPVDHRGTELLYGVPLKLLEPAPQLEIAR